MDLKEMIEERLLDKNGNPSRIRNPKNADLISEIVKTVGVNDVKTAVYMVYHGVPQKMCEFCGRGTQIRNFQLGFVSRWCSPKCRDSDPVYLSEFKESLKKVDKKAANEVRRQNALKKYGVDHWGKTEEGRRILSERNQRADLEEADRRRRQTNLERYGVEYPMQLEENRIKASETLMERYGITNPNYSEEFTRRKIQTNLERYGAEWPAQNPEVYAKTIKTTIERYGVPNANQSDEIRERIEQTCLERYGSKTFLTSQQFMDEYGYTPTSRAETTMAGLITSLGLEWEKTRSIIAPYEIDIWIPDHRLGIEVNGLFWHSEEAGNRNRWSHWWKTVLVRNTGGHLIHFTDQEILKNPDWCLEVVERNIRKEYPEGDLDLNLYPPVLRGWVEIVPPRPFQNDGKRIGVGDRTYWDVGLMRK